MITSQGDLPGVKLDGRLLEKDRANQGKGWQISSYDLRKWRGSDVMITLTAGGDSFPFASSDAQIDVDLILDRPVNMSKMVDDMTSPWALGHGYRRQSSRLYSGSFLAEKNASSGKLNTDDLKSAKAAKLKMRHFGSNGGQYSNKIIILNGREIAKLPVTSGGDRWEMAIIDLPPNVLKFLKHTNQIVVRDATGDSFKVKDFQLAVQATGGEWVLSKNSDTVHCSRSDWKYAEGRFFDTKAGESAIIQLDFR